MTLIANKTNPATTTSALSEVYASVTSQDSGASTTSTSSRLPPDTTYTQWTAQAAVTSGTDWSSAAMASPTQGNAGERTKAGGLLWR